MKEKYGLLALTLINQGGRGISIAAVCGTSFNAQMRNACEKAGVRSVDLPSRKMTDVILSELGYFRSTKKVKFLGRDEVVWVKK